MTTEQILDGRRLCVNFMGLKPTPSHGGGWGWSDTPYFSTQNNPDYEVALEHIVKYAKYDSDWNWLMEVFQRIGDLCDHSDNSDALFASEEWNALKDAVIGANIEGSFEALVSFIQFYNDNSSK